MFACVEAPLKISAVLASVSCTQLITSWTENRLLAYVNFKLAQFRSIPPLIFLLFPIG